MTRFRALLLFSCVLLLASPGVVCAQGKKKKGKKGKPVWPVPNPSFDQPFTPADNVRQISGVFGPRLKWGGGRYDHHEGIDFYAQFDAKYRPGNYNHPVFAVLPGTVSEVIRPRNPERTSTGLKVVVTHDVPWAKFGGEPDWGPVRTAYLHLSAIGVTQGQRVAAGEELGRAGESGYTSTVHLHFNCYRAGGRMIHVNPARLFSPKRFPRSVAPLNKKTIEVDWLERSKDAGTVLIRVLLPYNAYTLDGFAIVVDKDASRQIGFEHVSATMRDKRDTGDTDLFENLRVFPLRYNGGGPVDRVNRKTPQGWPMSRYPVEGGKGVRLGFDLLATNVPPKAKKIKLVVLGVLGEKVTLQAPGFRNRS